MTKTLSKKRIIQIKRLNSLPRTKKWLKNMSDAHLGIRPNWKYKYNNIKEGRDSRRVKRIFGITIEEYNKFFKEQNKCQICGSIKQLGLDHCHSTMKIRGVLCYNCNVAIGFFKDNVSLMKKAIKYILRVLK